MQKVLIIGSCGSGKSVFAKRLGSATGLPVIHLDTHFWKPGWVETPKDVWPETVAELLKGDSWIIDGNYSGTMEMRLEHCDTAIFLDMPRTVCTWRVLKRAYAHRGKTRPDLAPGCPEKIDLEFLKWTWNYPTRSRPRVLEKLRRVADRVRIVTLTSDREKERFLTSL